MATTTRSARSTSTICSADAHGRSVSAFGLPTSEGGFASMGEINAVVTRLETWSAHLFEFLKTGGRLASS